MPEALSLPWQRAFSLPCLRHYHCHGREHYHCHAWGIIIAMAESIFIAMPEALSLPWQRACPITWSVAMALEKYIDLYGRYTKSKVPWQVLTRFGGLYAYKSWGCTPINMGLYAYQNGAVRVSVAINNSTLSSSHLNNCIYYRPLKSIAYRTSKEFYTTVTLLTLSRNRVKVPITRPKERRTLPRLQDPLPLRV